MNEQKGRMPTNDAVTKISGEFTKQSKGERELNARLLELSSALLPQFGPQWNLHSLVSLKRQTISRLLYYDSLYRQIVDKPGVICEFGVQWGASLAQLINLRGIYEPFNHSRTIVGFDTFEGFASVNEKDGAAVGAGDYATTRGYERTLEEVLAIHEQFSPIPHVRKFELVKGDATEKVPAWLAENPHAIIAMAIFDMDLYAPTKAVAEAILPRLTKGSLLVFDELNCKHFPGETLAVIESFGLNNLALRRHPHQPYCAWAVFGE